MVRPWQHARSLWSLFLILTIVVSHTSCDQTGQRTLPPATGNAGDLLVVMDSVFWNGATGEVVGKCFSAPQEGLPQAEPLFDVIRLTPKNFGKIFKTTRNIVLVSRKEKGPAKKYAIQRNLWAEGQLVLTLFSDQDESVAKVLLNSCDGLIQTFQTAELMRLNGAFNKLKSVELGSLVHDKFGISPNILSDYKKAVSNDSVVWLRKDFDHGKHRVSMGLIFSSRPYHAEQDFQTETIVAHRNRVVKVVNGPTEKSYMKTYMEYKPVSKTSEVNGTFVKTTRGLWNMEGVFMGGPFVNVSFVNEEGTKLITIDGYVFAPGTDKREFLREVEAVATSAIK